MDKRVNVLITAMLCVIMYGKSNAGFSYSRDVVNVHDEIKSFIVSKERHAKNNAQIIVSDFESRRRTMLKSVPNSACILALNFQYPIESSDDVITAFVSTNNIYIGTFSGTNVLFITDVRLCIGQTCGNDIVEKMRDYSYVYPVGLDDNVRTVYVLLLDDVDSKSIIASSAFKCFDIPFNWVDKTGSINFNNCWGDRSSIETFKDIARIINIVLQKVNSMLPKSSLKPV